VHLASGRVLAARAVIYTPANLQPVLPAWARQLPVAPPSQQQQEQEQQACELPAGIATSDSIDLRGAEVAGKRVVVVGGGMSAGLLAAGAAERGAKVTLVCRR
jgi:NADPH-dependent 2,4-dienoyl-CoA reductase/sulfur reductase-like enzyme